MACTSAFAAINIEPEQAGLTSSTHCHDEFMSLNPDTMAGMIPVMASLKPVENVVPGIKLFASAGLNSEMQTVIRDIDAGPTQPTTQPADASLVAKCKGIMNSVYGQDDEDSDCVSEEGGEENQEDARCLAFQNHLNTLMKQFWTRVEEQTKAAITDTDFTRHDLPIARIKRIMRQDACDNPRLMGRDGASATAFGCELFIRALTTRSWAFAELSNRHTLQRRDLLAAMMSDNQYDFLIDVTGDAIIETNRKQSEKGQGKK